MGLIKNAGRYIPWFEKYGFRYDKNPVAGDGTPGYERGYSHANGREYLWITICPPQRKVFLSNELECGGSRCKLLWEKELNFPDEICDTDDNEIIDWLDNELDIE